MSQEKTTNNQDSSENSSSDFSVELVVEKPKEEDKQVEIPLTPIFMILI